MSVVMKLQPAIELDNPEVMQWLYLRQWDLDANRGRGWVQRTPHVSRAHKFSSKAEAMALWREQSKVYPLRPDGEPNRPLTAYHAEIEEVA